MEGELRETVNGLNWLGRLPSWFVTTIKSFITRSHDDPMPSPAPPPPSSPTAPPILIAQNNEYLIPIDSLSPSSSSLSLSSSSSPSSSSIDSQRASWRWMNGAHTTIGQTTSSFLLRRSPTMSQLELPYYRVQDTPSRADHDYQSHIFHSIIVILREQELGRHILVLTVPLTTGLVYNPNSNSSLAFLIAMALLIGFVAIWNGILLRGMFPRAANAIEQTGVACIFLGFFLVVGSFLPVTLIWAPVVCGVLSLLPFAIAAFSR